jgi:hypothetical protein
MLLDECSPVGFEVSFLKFHWYDAQPNQYHWYGRIGGWKCVTVWIGRLTTTLNWSPREK